IVLLKGFDQDGFVFFTNYESEKGVQLEANPYAALAFYWIELDRQIRIGGKAEKTSREESQSYFHSRPLGSQLGAWASRQSEVLDARRVLDARMAEMTERFGNKPIPLPPHWGGYRVIPDMMEFWQGRPNRLHDRFRYRLQSDGSWLIERLAPLKQTVPDVNSRRASADRQSTAFAKATARQIDRRYSDFEGRAAVTIC